MNHVLVGLREGALTITYNVFLAARGAERRLRRPRQIGVRVLALRDNRVLLVRHRGGPSPWSLPGGGPESGETLEATALRELREEACCSGTVRFLHGVFHNFDEGMSNFTAIFVCEPLSEARPPVADLEIVDARFFLIDDLPANLDPGSRRRVEEYVHGRHGLYGPW